MMLTTHDQLRVHRRQVLQRLGAGLLVGAAGLLTTRQVFAQCTQAEIGNGLLANGVGCKIVIGVHGIAAIAQDGDVATQAWRAGFFPTFNLKQRANDWWFHLPIQTPRILNDNVQMRFAAYTLTLHTSEGPNLVELVKTHIYDGHDLRYEDLTRLRGQFTWGGPVPAFDSNPRLSKSALSR
jgi:hypothetical protein